MSRNKFKGFLTPPLIPQPSFKKINDESILGSGSLIAYGPTGQQGIIGLQGLQGLQGAQGLGDTGLNGIQSNNGFQGIAGFQGSQSIHGFQGAQGFGPPGFIGMDGMGIGIQGLQGAQGFGPDGDPGEHGIQGNQGQQGRQGWQGFGDIGINGLQGNQGWQGSGDIGPQGFQGIDGTQGTQGVQTSGLRGIQSLNGFIGSIGFQGNQGFQASNYAGQRGYDGIIGPQGSQGNQGSQGDYVWNKPTIEWVPNTNYKKYELVTYNNTNWISPIDHLSDNTKTPGTNWFEPGITSWASFGTQGVQGLNGTSFRAVNATESINYTWYVGDLVRWIWGSTSYLYVCTVQHANANGSNIPQNGGAWASYWSLLTIDGVQGNQAPRGNQGNQGNQGINGADGSGVPVGGAFGSLLSKVDSTDYNVEWTPVSSSGNSAISLFRLGADSSTNQISRVTFHSFSVTAGKKYAVYIRMRWRINNSSFRRTFGFTAPAATQCTAKYAEALDTAGDLFVRKFGQSASTTGFAFDSGYGAGTTSASPCIIEMYMSVANSGTVELKHGPFVTNPTCIVSAGAFVTVIEY